MSDKVTLERQGSIYLIGVNRPDKRNAWDLEVIETVSMALKELAEDDSLRVGVIFGHGPHFTAGMDLPALAPVIGGGGAADVIPEGGLDPWDFISEPCPKPVAVAVHGRCYTLGIELILASQIAVAADDTIFAQLEVARGMSPLGGATLRLPAKLGPAGTRYLLTAEEFDAATALDIGLVTEVVPVGRQLERAVELAEVIASNAPLAVQAALASVRAAERAAREAAAAAVRDAVPGLFSSEDLSEAVNAMMERRDPVFNGR